MSDELDIQAPLVKASVYKRAGTSTWTFILPVCVETGYIKRPSGRVMSSFVGAAVHVHCDGYGQPVSLGVAL